MLTPEQRRARFEAAKKDLLAENSFLAQRWKEGSNMHERLIRSRVVRDLQNEPMYLVCPEVQAVVLQGIVLRLQNLSARRIEKPGANSP